MEDLSGSHGVSIFLPATASSFYNAENYDFAAGAVWENGGLAEAQAGSTTWGRFLVNFFQFNQPGGPDDLEIPLPIARLDPYETIFLLLISR